MTRNLSNKMTMWLTGGKNVTVDSYEHDSKKTVDDMKNGVENIKCFVDKNTEMTNLDSKNTTAGVKNGVENIKCFVDKNTEMTNLDSKNTIDSVGVGHAAGQDEEVRDYLDKHVSMEQRKGDCDSLAGRGEEGLDRVHHAGDVGGGHAAGQ